MSFRPFLATVVRSERVAPNFQRVTFTGIDAMGPAVPIRDLRIKLLIPPASGVLSLPEEGWWDAWRAMPEHTRGHLRTYSIRKLRRYADGPDEVDVDFVLHNDNPGPASAWAQDAQPGQQLLIIGPTRDDDSGVGIEFNPGSAARACLYGDETALPAIARILEDWPEGLAGSADIEVPAGNHLPIDAPAQVDVRWHFREHDDVDYGDLLLTQLKDEVDSRSAAVPMGAGKPDLVDEVSHDEVWETPTYSSSGESIASALDAAGHTYYWIAGKNTAVKAMRRLLVSEVGVPRHHVSFMGYWR
ncbi:siderophore-interacting protein [Corynebacterium riegelii]|uniref:siderophore-interacting protein n=1 Tax=Corynebacterium riegelii TaxID=156976 RepID=UPI00191D1A95|nr:siderophore-interacting protein [Corynebacterium riegelii]QQU84404.1 siderophore-interacting protein [Corynebacterium riegelii]